VLNLKKKTWKNIYTKKDSSIETILESWFGILQQNEYNPLGNIAWVHLGAKSEIGCMWTLGCI